MHHYVSINVFFKCSHIPLSIQICWYGFLNVFAKWHLHNNLMKLLKEVLWNSKWWQLAYNLDYLQNHWLLIFYYPGRFAHKQEKFKGYFCIWWVTFWFREYYHNSIIIALVAAYNSDTSSPRPKGVYISKIHIFLAKHFLRTPYITTETGHQIS